MPNALPGVIDLIKQGIEIYKQQYRRLIEFSFFSLLVSLVLFALLALVVLLGILLYHSVPLAVLIVLGVIIGIVIVIAGIWWAVRLVISQMYIIRNHDTKMSVSDAWLTSKGLVWPFVWIGILNAVAALVPILIAAIITVPLGIVFNTKGWVICGACIVIVTIVSGILIGTWLSFSSWVFVDEQVKGVQALKESKNMVDTRFGAVFWRLFGIYALFAIAQAALRIVLDLVFLILPGHTGDFISEGIVTGLVQLVGVPILLAATFCLYKSLKTPAPIVSAANGTV